jgi:hypothetical protein
MGIINEFFTKQRANTPHRPQQLSYLATLAAQARNSRAAARQRRTGGER